MKEFHYLAITVSVLSLVLLTYSSQLESAYGQMNRYWVALIPNVTTDATGFVGFKFSDDFKELVYTINVDNIRNITGAFLYLKNDTRGTSPILDLLKKPRESSREADRWSNATKEGQITGTINLTGVTKKDLTGPLDSKSIEYLVKLMRENMLYIAVYTIEHPSGELKGDSFVSMDDVFNDANEFNW